MTVKSLNTTQKQAIADSFRIKEFTITELMALYGRSRRTIIRALEEMDCDPCIRHREKKLKKPTPLPTLHVPWYRRVYASVVQFSQKARLTP